MAQDDFDQPIERAYRLGDAVGRGAFGEILRANDVRTGAPVAVKRLLEKTPDPLADTRFRREARLLAVLNSPHVVKHLAHGRDDAGRPCLVLEWLDGEDLLQRQRRDPLPHDEAIEVARQAALGLAALHAAGIVHRDVKPANFFLLAEPRAGARVKLLDLGIAHVVGEPAPPSTDYLLGTPAYMSPEQARGEANLTPRSDLFSLGTLLYELLAGVKPFRHKDPFALLTKIILQDAPPLRDRAAGVPPAAERAVARAMSRTPAARFGTALEMAAALESALARPPAAIDSPATAPAPHLGEQRVVTALFAGLEQGPLAEGHAGAFETLVREHGGDVYRVLGRGAVGVFGQERSLGDEPLRAARAGIAAGSLLPGARLAVSTCRMRVGATSLPDEAIERGVALLALGSGALRVDAPTARMLSSHFELENDAGDAHSPAHVVRGERPPDRDAPPRLMGRETRMCGRDQELAGLLSWLRGCVQTQSARVALVTAPAGAGKSRLRYEWQRRAREEFGGARVLVARGDPMRAGSPHALLAQALRVAAGVRDGEGGNTARERFRARVAQSVPEPERARVAEFLGEVAGLEFSDAESVPLRAARQDPRLMADQQRRAWEDFLAAECALGPVALVLEDLHWGDWPSVTMLDAALGVLHDRPLFVLALARPEVRERFPALWSARALREVRLGELPREAAEALARDALGDGAAASLVERLVERAAGNAFFLEELLRAAAEQPGETAPLPETVWMIVQARLERFEPGAREVMRAASVFGQVFWRAGVAAVLQGERAGQDDGEGDSAYEPRLAELAAREVLAPRGGGERLSGQREYAFRHAIVREAAYAMLAEADRVAAHAAAGRWLETAGERDALVLAGHFERGGDGSRAVRWYVRAAQQALDASDLDAVFAHAARAEACGAAGETMGSLGLLLAEAHRLRGELARVEQRALEAFVRLPRGGAEWFGAVAALCNLAMALGRAQWLAELTEEIDALWGEYGATAGYVTALAQAVVSMCALGQVEAARGPAEKLAAVARDFDELDVVAARTVRHALAAVALHRGDLGGNLAWLYDTLPVLERAGDVRGVCQIQTQLGYGYITTGAYARAVTALREALAVAEQLRLARPLAIVKNNLGFALAQLGELAEGRAVEESAVASFHAQGDRRLEGSSRAYLARILWRSGDAAGAEREARLAAEQLEGAPPLRGGVMALLARLARERGDLEGAGRWASGAMELLAAHGSEAEEGLIRLEHAEWLRATGREHEARAALAEARAVLEARAARIADSELRGCFLRGDPDHARLLALAAAFAPT